MIGDKIKAARIELRISLQDLSKEVQLRMSEIKKYENNKAIPSSDILIKLSKSLNVKVSYFFRDNNDFDIKNVFVDFFKGLISESKAAELLGISVIKFREL